MYRPAWWKNVTRHLWRHGGRCCYCGLQVPPRRTAFSPTAREGYGLCLDHFVPERGGGRSVIENVVIAGTRCHSRKGDKYFGAKSGAAIQAVRERLGVGFPIAA